ncbi:hypothetical protein [Streptomyces sp. IB2014 016-6]|uniref:hypothetical protein n=1 Tax=Streptomyces sp. IB2014 016-6 TaxID=2517818 RepID=UPI0011C73D38|nr:hypothetical protein [Streptomyces sp. IB2014 016-6]TXL87692.1 hypothetical protein EW053_22500 [Streptomyces sp. IB2014 016-6]
MSDIATATWTTYVDGEPVQDLHQVLGRWALTAEAEAEDDATVARLKAGDFTGCVLQDGQEHHTGAA